MKWLKLISIALILSLCVQPDLFAQETIVLASGEWRPYFSENLKHYGVVSRIVTEAFALEGVKAEYVFRPWKHSLAEAQKGKYHGSPGWLKNDKRLKNFFYTDAIAHNTNVFFFQKGSGFDWNSIADLKKYKIEGVNGFFYGKEFMDAEKQDRLKVQRNNSEEMGFRKLGKGRTDVIICDLEVGYDLINKLFTREQAKQFTHHPKPLQSDSLYLLMSKKVAGNRRLVSTFNNGLKRLLESGKVEQYYDESRQGDYKLKIATK